MDRFSISRSAGWFAVSMLISQLLSVAGLVNIAFVTLLAWVAMAAMWPTLKSSARKQSLILFILGFAGLLTGVLAGTEINWFKVFAGNVPLLSMFVAISFLSLTNAPPSDEQLPKGSKAAAITAIGTTLLGAIINLSVIFVFGDRLKRDGKLTDAQQIVLSRCFSAAAWWSPFFIATGVAIMYAPGMAWKSTMVPGLIMAALGISYTILDIKRRGSASFHGYPIKVESLFIPLLLATSVLLLHHYLPQINIVVLISILSVIGSLLFMKDRPRLPALKHFADERLLSAGSQFALFLAAGVFSAGISTLLAINPDLIDLHQFAFDTPLFALCSGMMILAGLVGVHPVITIAIVSPILLPLNPNTTSLGFMFLSTWAISTGSGPLSGIGLVMTGRYGATPKQIVKNSWHYVLVMWLLACALNELLFH